MPGIVIGANTVFASTFGGGPSLPVVNGNILWLRADLGITLNGADVAGWADQSGNGNDATQGTAADQPAFSAAGGPNGLPAVDFDRSNTESLDLVGMGDASNDYTIFAVLDHSSITGKQNLLSTGAADDFLAVETSQTAVLDRSAHRYGMAAKTGEQILTYRLDATGTATEFWRDGTLLGADTYDGSWAAWTSPTIGDASAGGEALDAKLSELIIFNRKLTNAEVALVHAYLAARYDIAFSPLSVANCGAWWDLDHATVAGGILTAITDRALAQTINVVGSPAVVAISGDDFVRFDGTDDVLWIADAAALDGAAGNTHVLKHANCESLPVVAAFATKGGGTHKNGGLIGIGSSGTRFTAYGSSGTVVDAGPLAEFTSPAETIAMAMESGVAVRRVDGDGTYASTVTAVTTAAGADDLSWGGRDDGAGGFDWLAEIDLRAAAYYNRPLNQQELEAVRDFLEAA